MEFLTETASVITRLATDAWVYQKLHVRLGTLYIIYCLYHPKVNGLRMIGHNIHAAVCHVSLCKYAGRGRYGVPSSTRLDVSNDIRVLHLQ